MTSLERLALTLALVAGFTSMISFGILGKGRTGKVGNFDGAVLYAAGRTWLEGGNPYSHERLSQSVAGVVDLTDIVFFYPPQSAGICVLQGHFSYPTAKNLWLGINLACVAVIIGLTAYTLRKRNDPVGAWVMAAVIMGNPFTTHVLWMGQTSLLALAALLASFTSYSIAQSSSAPKGWRLLAGVCLGIASYKPQLCLLLGLWFLLEREWLILIASASMAAVLSYTPMMVQGPLGMLQAWQASISDYSKLPFNADGAVAIHKVGMDTLLQAANFKVSGLLFTGLALLATLGAWLLRSRFFREDILAILMALTFAFVGFNHDYDYVAMIPMLTALWYYASRRPAYWAVVAPLVILFFFPQRFVRLAGIPALDQWRTIVVVLFLWAVLYFSYRTHEETALVEPEKAS